MIIWLTAFCAIINYQIIIAVVGPQQPPLEIIKEWNLINYNFEFNAPTHDINYYNPQNILQTGLAVGYDRIFIATPRLFSGVPATVSEISRTSVNKSPDYKAFPDWSFHTAGLRKYNCSDLGLVSVYRLRIDSCNRLWALDAGVSRSLEDYEVTCPPKILVFDLNTNQVVRRIDFPRQVYRGESLFTNLIIDETTSKEGGCDDVFIYISDTVEPAIVVYDSARDLTWRVTHPAMYPDPDFAQSQIGDYKFILMDGIVGLTFDDRAGIIYFQPLATDRIFSVTKETLRSGPLPVGQFIPVRLVGKKSSQGIGLAVSPFDSSLIFSPLTETAVASWNPSTNEQSLLASDDEALQFVADITLTSQDPGALYMVSSKFHRFFLKNVDSNEVNNRIMRIELPGYRPAFHFNQPLSYNPIYQTGNEQYQPYPQQNSIEKRHPQASIQYLGRNEYFTGIRQPFQYEPVGLINRGLTNPFTSLNQGESFPKIGLPTISKTPLYQPNSLLKRILPVPTYQNYFRFKKNVSQNQTSYY